MPDIGQFIPTKFNRFKMSYPSIDEIKRENERLKGVIRSALAISDLWLPIQCDEEHVEESRALLKMRDLFLEALG